MKNKLFTLALILFSMAFISCSSDDDENGNTAQEEDVRYYVKYELEMSTLNVYARKGNAIITFTSEKGTEVVETTALSWNGTYGPLAKGTVIRLNVASETSGEYNHARIYVSRDKEPFVIKAEDAGKHDIALSYTIDF